MSRIVFNSAHSLKYFPNNKPNDFTVNIPIKLSAIGRNLEVALNEITFPSGFINVRNGYNEISAILAMDEGEELTVDEITEMPRINFKIEPNFYNPKSLIDEINLKIDKASMEIGINEDNNRGWITANKKIRVKFGLDIAKILGFNSGEWLTFGPEKTISPNHAGAYKNMSLLNVYCNIVEESVIGGKWVGIAEKMSIRYLGPDGPKYLGPTLSQPRWLFRLTPIRVRTWQGVGWAKSYWVESTGGATWAEAHSGIS